MNGYLYTVEVCQGGEYAWHRVVDAQTVEGLAAVVLAIMGQGEGSPNQLRVTIIRPLKPLPEGMTTG